MLKGQMPLFCTLNQVALTVSFLSLCSIDCAPATLPPISITRATLSEIENAVCKLEYPVLILHTEIRLVYIMSYSEGSF